MAGKKFKKAITGWDPLKKHSVAEACALLPKTKISTKWDETVDVAIRLGVNPKYADQMVRGSVVMPSGTGKTKRVLVICKTEKIKPTRSPRAPTSPATTSTSTRSRTRTGSSSTPWSPPRT
jgi:large subunit ribosomal protein L1